jgi:hypothetical protein
MKKKLGIGGVLTLALAMMVACTQSQLETALNLTNTILQDLPAVLNVLSGFGVLTADNMTLAQKATAEATQDFELSKTLIAEYKANPTQSTADKIRALEASAQKHLNEILDACHQLDQQKRDLITGVVQFVIATSQQIMAIFPTTPTVGAVKSANAVKLPSPQEFDARFHQLAGQ